MSERTLVSFDWAIKNILRDKANFDVLEGFLSTLLKHDIKILSILESEGNQQQETDKFNRVDLVVENDKGELLVVEVQNSRETHYLERLLYGSSKLIIDHLKLGDKYGEIRKVVSISILYFLLGEGDDDYIYHGKTDFYGLNTHRKLEFKQKRKEAILNVIESEKNIFPEYYLIEVERFQNVIKSDIDEWIYFLKNSEIKPEFRSKNIQKAGEKLDLLKMEPEKRKVYERYLSNLAVEKDVIDTAHDDGKLEGIAKTARNMLKDGMPIEKVAIYTELTVDEIRQILKNEQK